MILANGKGSPQEVFSVAVRNFSKRLLEAMLQGEMEAHLNGVHPTADESSAEEGAGNKLNGLTQKTLKTEFGPLTVDVPRDRNGSFDPVVVPKHCRSFGKIDEQIITVYSRGMSTRDIQAFVENLYGVNISPDYVSAVTDRALEEMHEWASRSLESVYPVAFFDALRVKIRSGVAVKNMAVHLAVGVRVDGTREVQGMWLAENEGSAFWAGVFNELKNRGVEDFLIAVTDGLKRMTEALETVFPQAWNGTVFCTPIPKRRAATVHGHGSFDQTTKKYPGRFERDVSSASDEDVRPFARHRAKKQHGLLRERHLEGLVHAVLPAFGRNRPETGVKVELFPLREHKLLHTGCGQCAEDHSTAAHGARQRWQDSFELVYRG